MHGADGSGKVFGESIVWYNCPYLRAQVELTPERREHIGIRHPDVVAYLNRIGAVLELPDEIRRSQRDVETLLFYRMFVETLGGKNVVVVVKVGPRSFILSVYLSRTRLNGETVWTRS